MMRNQKDEKTYNTRMFVRILPGTDFHYDSIKIESNKKVLYVRCLQDLSKGVNMKNPHYWYFCTDGVFWNSCQSEVYEAVTSNLYAELFDGVRAMIMCYGQTGTGKTFTTSGLLFPFENRGLSLRILSQLFEEKEARRDVAKVVFGMSYLEFNGQNIKDLISNKKLRNFKDVLEYTIPDEACAWEILFKAETRKSLTESAPYKCSNRGHSVLTFYIHSESLIDTDPVIRHSKVHIVDMGGIDHVGNTPSSWKNKMDLGNANVSKTLMEQLILCLSGVAWKSENQIGLFKSNQFLAYLHDTLRQTCLLRVIAHIYGNIENLSLTLSTLKFGERIRALKPKKLERVYQSSTELHIRNLEKECSRLREEVELATMLKNPCNYANISQDRFQEVKNFNGHLRMRIKRAAEAFLFGQLENLTLLSLGQANLTLEVFKDIYRKLAAEREQIIKDAVFAAKEVLQSQIMTEKTTTSKTSIIPIGQKVSRRKSRQVDSQISLRNSNRSPDSVQNFGKSSVAQQAGVTDRKGIGIGPGKTSSNFEGNVTKAFKKLKSKKSDTVIVKGNKSSPTRDFGTVVNKNQIFDEVSELSVGQEIPSKESAWQNFFNEKTEWAVELHDKMDSAEESVKEAKRKYSECLGELAKIREQIEANNAELENCQHVRKILGKDESEGESNLVTKDSERSIMQIIAQKEELLNSAVENCHLALLDYKTASEALSEAKKNLEDAFQEFCKEHYKIIFPFSDLASCEVKSEESGKGTPSELDLRNQARAELYAQLQKKLLNFILKKPKSGKKEWVTLF